MYIVILQLRSKNAYHILTIFLRRDTNAHTPMLCILKQRCMYIYMYPPFPLICPYTVLNTSIIARSEGGHKYNGQSRGSRLLLNFSTHCFSSNFLFFSWGKITTLHLWDCDVTVGNFPTNESLDSYARAKRALVFLVRCFKKKMVCSTHILAWRN